MARKHPTHAVLVRTAMRLFAEKGYNSTSVADILQQSKVHSEGLYHHFKTKQDLLVSVLETYRDGIEAMLMAPLGPGSRIRWAGSLRCSRDIGTPGCDGVPVWMSDWKSCPGDPRAR